MDSIRAMRVKQLLLFYTDSLIRKIVTAYYWQESAKQNGGNVRQI